jgi:hypothetical protein
MACCCSEPLICGNSIRCGLPQSLSVTFTHGSFDFMIVPSLGRIRSTEWQSAFSSYTLTLQSENSSSATYTFSQGRVSVSATWRCLRTQPCLGPINVFPASPICLAMSYTQVPDPFDAGSTSFADRASVVDTTAGAIWSGPNSPFQDFPTITEWCSNKQSVSSTEIARAGVTCNIQSTGFIGQRNELWANSSATISVSINPLP